MFPQKINSSKEETLGKLMKVYVAQSMLDKGVQSVQDQGLNVLTEFLIKMIRQIGMKAQKIYELQGRQEGNIFHVLLALDNLKVKPNEILSHLNEQTDRKEVDQDSCHLNRMLNSLMEQIFKEKYGQAEEEYHNNIRTQRNPIKIEHLLPDPSIAANSTRNIEDSLAVPQYFRDDIAVKEKKEITEKELKNSKKQYQLSAEDDSYDKKKQLLIEQNREQFSQEYAFDGQYNQFNVPVKKIKSLDEINRLIN